MRFKNIEHDELWKAALETFFDDFLKLFYSEWLELFDFDKPVEFLDKELSKIIPKSESKNRRADKLVKVFLKDGTEQWFLIHIEIQGQHEENFAERMFHYFYRIRDKYNRPVTAFALFTYARNGYPSVYEYEMMGTKLRYEYRTFSVLEMAKKQRSNKNIFAYLIEVAYYEATTKDDKILLTDLLNIVKGMEQNGISIRDFRFLLDFVNGYIRRKNNDFFSIFEKEIDLIIKSSESMGLQELFELKAKEQLLAVQKALELSEQEKLRIVKEAEAFREKVRREAAAAKLKEAELKQAAELKEAELKQAAELKEAELKQAAELKEAELKQAAELKEAELKQAAELKNQIVIKNMHKQNMNIDLICMILQLDKNYVQRIIDKVEE